MPENSLIVEAAKFLKAAEEQALNNIKGQIQSKENTIHVEGISFVSGLNLGSTRNKWLVKTNINGQNKELEGTFDADIIDSENDIKEKLVSAVMASIHGTLFDHFHLIFKNIR